MSQRFTIDGSDALEQRISLLCDKVREGVRAIVPAGSLEGIALAGGYGRGEGGVLRENGADLPYNDLEFFVFIRGLTPLNDRRHGRALHLLGERLSAGAGLDVEMKIVSLRQLRRSGPSMFYYDLVMGHQWTLGEEALLRGCDHHRHAEAIPLHEAARLLMNRCSGLLYAAERLERPGFTAADADFTGRNIAKARLALGDVALAARGLYHWSCRERHRRLAALQDQGEIGAELLAQHALGVEFKLHPVRSIETAAMLEQQHQQVSRLARDLWLWLEGRRLEQAYESPQAYAMAREVKCPEQPRWKNLLVNARTFGLRTALSRAGLRYPRERLLRSLPLLLWGMPKPEHQAMVAECLRCDAGDFPQAVQAYARLWQRFN